MDIDLENGLRRYGVQPRGVIHVGAHEGQEYGLYAAMGISRQIWVEPQPLIFARLAASVPSDERIVCINAACGPAHGTATMHVLEGNEGKSNSLLEPTLHLERWPEFKRGGTINVRMAPLDDLLKESSADAADFNLLCVDVQGFELEVLKGAEGVLREADAVVCEVSATPLYGGGCTVGQIDKWLGVRGFARLETVWSSGISGDALYVRRARLSALARLRLAALGPRNARPPRSARDWAARTAARV
jgi:FkbM family methyltransferase